MTENTENIEMTDTAHFDHPHTVERFLNTTLKPYQWSTLQPLLGDLRHKGAIINFAPGLGKTLVVIAYVMANLYRARNQPLRILVIAPKAAIHEVWVKQFNQHVHETYQDLFNLFVHPKHTSVEARAKHLRTCLQHNTSSICVTTYDMAIQKGGTSLFDTKWDIVILDEVHYLKNRQSQRHTILHKCLKANGHRHPVLGLTGTFGGNHSESEIPNILRCVFPHQPKWSDPQRYDGVQSLPSKLRRRVFIETWASSGMTLPTPVYKEVKVTLSLPEAKVYEKRLKSCNDAYRIYLAMRHTPQALVANQHFQGQLQALQMCVMLPPEGATSCSKLDALMDCIDQCLQNNDSTTNLMVACTSIQVLHLAQHKCLQTYPEHLFALYTGQMSSTRRTAELERTLPDAPQQARVLFLSTMAGGIAITLTHFKHFVLVDEPLNPTTGQQLIHRGVRLTLDHSLTITRIIAERTIDEAKYINHQSKTRVSNRVIQQFQPNADTQRCASNKGFKEDSKSAATVAGILQTANQCWNPDTVFHKRTPSTRTSDHTTHAPPPHLTTSRKRKWTREEKERDIRKMQESLQESLQRRRKPRPNQKATQKGLRRVTSSSRGPPSRGLPSRVSPTVDVLGDALKAAL